MTACKELWSRMQSVSRRHQGHQAKLCFGSAAVHNLLCHDAPRCIQGLFIHCYSLLHGGQCARFATSAGHRQRQKVQLAVGCDLLFTDDCALVAHIPAEAQLLFGRFYSASA